MKTLRRVVGLFLVTVLLFSYPLTCFAGGASVSLSPETYVIGLLLDSLGVDVSLSSLSSLYGEWDTYEDFVSAGKQGKLGLYDQWEYDHIYAGREDDIAQARAEFQENFGWLMGAKSASWGEKIPLSEGALQAGYDRLKSWLSTFPSFGTDSLDFNSVPARGTDYVSALDVNAISYFGISYTVTPDSGIIIPIYDSDGNGIRYFLISLSPHSGTYYTGYVTEKLGSSRRNFTYNGTTYTYFYSYVYMPDRYTTTSDFFGLSIDKIPHSNNLPPADVMEPYIIDLLLSNVVIPVQSVNSELSKTGLKTVGGIALPADADLAQEKLESINMSDKLEEIIKAIQSAGLVIDYPVDVPDESESSGETDANEEEKTVIGSLSDLIAKVEAIPSAIASILDKKLDSDNVDEDVANMKLPVNLSDKFPFCIPFDVIYLVKAMNASSEVPRFELPFKIHYQNINYEHTFIVDMTEWDTAVKILRTMLDLLFIAGLISTTRELIRG